MTLMLMLGPFLVVCAIAMWAIIIYTIVDVNSECYDKPTADACMVVEDFYYSYEFNVKGVE